MAKLLVIDDEAPILFSIEQVFDGQDLQVLCAKSPAEGLRLFSDEDPDAVLLDIRLGGSSGLDLFKTLRELDPRVLVIFITGHGTTDTAIEAMKLGAYDYLVKPLDVTQLRHTVSQAIAISRLMHQPAILEQADKPEGLPDRLIGGGPMMQAACKQIGRVAPQDVYVLILGESGTGKELVARAIYQHSRRSQAPFLAINCAAIPESLLESELFGHESGAFTGADRRRIGKFEQCHGGTIFLDEIGDMPLNTQAKILRLTQEGQFQRLGGNETIAVNVRIVAATNQDLPAMIEKGRFRKDLYYRLRGVTIHLPPLRQRKEDIPEMAHHFLFRFNREIGTTVQSISPDALAILEEYSWPGNVRELQSVIREALIASAGTTLLPEFLPPDVRLAAPSENSVDVPFHSDIDWQTLATFVETSVAAGERDVYRRALAHFDQMLIARAMSHAEGHQNRAAEILGLSRVTLRAKLRSLKLEVERILTAQKHT